MGRVANTRRARLTDKLAAAVDPPKPTPRKNAVLFIRDVVVPCFGLRVTQHGSRRFFLEYKHRKLGRRMIFGTFPGVTVAEARRRALAYRAQITDGRDPWKEARQAKSATAATVGDLIDAWRSGSLSDGRPLAERKKSWRDDEQRIRDFLEPWRRRFLDEVAPSDVATMHARIVRDRGGYVANRVLALLRAMLRQGQRHGLIAPGPLPTDSVTRFREQPRQRALNRREARLILASIAVEADPHWRAYFTLLILLGARKNELLSARWRDFDLESDEPSWRIARAKTDVVDLLELPTQAVEILTSLPRTASPFVFPGAGLDGHRSETKPAWSRILKRAEVADVRIHDLRRTLGTWLARRGLPLRAIARILGHASVSTTARHYIADSREGQREALEANAAALLELLPDEKREEQ